MNQKNHNSQITIDQFFMIPNILCYIRIVLIPIFIGVYVNATEIKDYYVAAAIIFISGLTDFADGFIARKFNMVSELGKFIDPLADKLTQAGILIALMFEIEGMWILVTLFFIKEISMAINAYVLFRRGKKIDGALWFGKVSTAAFYLVMFIIIVFPTLNVATINLLMVIAGFFLLLSFFKYTQVFVSMYKE